MRSDLYGFKSAQLDEIAERLGQALGIRFALHEGFYRGGDYYRFDMPGQEAIMLQRNWDLPDSEPMEMAFPDYPVILYVEQTLRSPEMQRQIEAAFGEKVSLLRHNLS